MSVLIVGCGVEQLPLLRAARRRGFHVVGADRSRQALGAGECDAFEECAPTDALGLAALAFRARVSAIATMEGGGTALAVAELAPRLGLPFYATAAQVRRAQVKVERWRACFNADLPVPHAAICADVAEALTDARDVGFPLVLKPARGWDQRGVVRADTPEELEQLFDNTMSFSVMAGEKSVWLESYAEGTHYTVTAWLERGAVAAAHVTERVLAEGKQPLGVRAAEIYPARLADPAPVIELARAGAAALEVTDGPIHAHVVGQDGRFVLLKSVPGPGSGLVAEVVRHATGFDACGALLDLARREPMTLASSRAPRPTALALMFAPKGDVVAIRGVEEARAKVLALEVLARPGDRLRPRGRLAYTIAHGDAPEAALTRAKDALAEVAIETRFEPSC